ncbi:mitochondrial coenzyme A diphosphatase NUDT8 isoform X2 [Chrysemys picta bellii]|uniref:mitochondrial coenzyme A diphosphatase NUDT8 isoform X2 n=1 Tax=Chrysemys picta bellii TaxID=8478 RepID=UPI0032B0FCB3
MLISLLHPKYAGKKSSAETRIARQWVLGKNPDVVPYLLSFKAEESLDSKIYVFIHYEEKGWKNLKAADSPSNVIERVVQLHQCPASAGVMFPALHHLRLGARPTLGATRAGGSPRGYLSQENEQRCRGLLETSTRRYRQEAVAAAVLVTLCSVSGYPALLYTLRSSTLTGHHKGDVSFPGGKCDSSDQDVIATALRETQEELGLHLGAESVWGVMKPLPTGVEDVFTIPLSHLLQAQNHGYTHFCQQGRYSYTLPVFLNGRYRVWGLTAIITDLTLELLAPSTYRRRTRPPSTR